MGRVKSFILLFLSDYKDDATEKNYVLEPEKKDYTGIQTCDAPAKALMDFAVLDGHPVDDVVYIASNRVVNEQSGKSENNLKEIVESQAKQQGEKAPECIRLPYDFNEGGTIADRGEIQNGIYEKIEEYLAKNSEYDEVRVYIDYTGGMRDTSFMMTSIIRYLEFTGASCRKIIYGEYREAKLWTLDNIYGIYQLINGVSEFVSTGSSVQLSRYFRNGKPEAKDLVNSMLDFSNAISLCDIEGISGAIEKLNEKTETFGKSDVNDLNSRMLATLMPYVRKKLFLDDAGKGSYTRLIEWCLENRFLQQAVTLYVEKVPAELFAVSTERKAERIEKELKIRLEGFRRDAEAGDYAKAFYEDLFDSLDAVAGFQALLPENADTDTNRGSVITLLNNIKQRESTDEKEKEAIGRLCDLIRFLFDGRGNRIAEKNFSDYEGTINQKELKGFLKSLKGTDKKLCRYLLTGENQDDQGRPNGKENTPIKKMESIKAVEEKTGDSKYGQALFEIMCSYLALKIVRNIMNHASEDDDTAGLKQAKEYLKENGFVIDPDPGSDTPTERYNNIATLIRKGLKANEVFLSI